MKLLKNIFQQQLNIQLVFTQNNNKKKKLASMKKNPILLLFHLKLNT